MVGSRKFFVLDRLIIFNEYEGDYLIMEPRIETLTGKKLIGKRVVMSFSEDKTRELWQSFMPRRKDIENSIGTDLYCFKSLQP